jgi:hypothetical protein
MNLQTAGGHLRQIENLIDQVAKVIGRSFDTLYRLYLTWSELSIHTFAKEIDKPNNRI